MGTIDCSKMPFEEAVRHAMDNLKMTHRNYGSAQIVSSQLTLKILE